jgi:NADH:ubiquinone oxidoreductase subunit E
MGACGMAPVIRINNNFHTDVSEEMLTEIITSIKEKEAL